MGNSTMNYIVSLCIAVFITAYLLPPAMVQLTNSSNWTGAPAAVISIATTVLGILIILGVAIALMPPSLKGKVGLWANRYPTVIKTYNAFRSMRFSKRFFASTRHFER